MIKRHRYNSSGVFLVKKESGAEICTALRSKLSDSSFHLVGTEASGTSIHMARRTVHNGLDPLHIGLPCPVGTSVGVRNLDTEGNTLATIITLCHSLHLLSVHDGSLIYAYKQALEYDSRVF